MPHREFCCNDLPPKSLVFSMGAIAVLLGLVALALGYGLVPVDVQWLHAPRWMLIGAGVTFIFGGIVITLISLPAHRRERSPQT
jgi:ABC-type multidrug transport system permease subunit